MHHLLEKSKFYQTQILFGYQTIAYSPVTAYK